MIVRHSSYKSELEARGKKLAKENRTLCFMGESIVYSVSGLDALSK